MKHGPWAQEMERVAAETHTVGQAISITWQHGSDGEDLVWTVEFTAGDDHLGQLGVQGELCHHGAQFRQVTVVIERCQAVQQLQGSHQGLWGCRRQNGRDGPLTMFQAHGAKRTWQRFAQNNLHYIFSQQNLCGALLPTCTSGLINTLVLHVYNYSQSIEN